jgi:mannose-1-phosphate guanylyltransferase
MAGGSGTRFWPESRKKRPKQLLQIISDKTMVRATAERILPEISFDRIMVVTTEVYAEEIKRELPEVSHNMIVAEPQGRNTAPCIALGAYKIAKQDPEAVLIILPADHLIANEEAFLNALRAAYQAASSNDYLITFGIVPSCPETGYGYIELGREISGIGSERLFHVKSFVEKPDLVTAKRYLAGGNYLWNSGMFVWKASTIIASFEEHLPSISRAMESILPALNTPHEPEAIREIYETIESVSVDYGIMEKANNAVVIRSDIAWNDVGSWSSLADVWDTDNENNACRGKVLCVRSKECVVLSPHKVAVLLGVEGLVIVDTPDAILVCRKDSCQDIKILQELLVQHGYEDLL